MRRSGKTIPEPSNEGGGCAGFHGIEPYDARFRNQKTPHDVGTHSGKYLILARKARTGCLRGRILDQPALYALRGERGRKNFPRNAKGEMRNLARSAEATPRPGYSTVAPPASRAADLGAAGGRPAFPACLIIRYTLNSRAISRGAEGVSN